MTTETAHHPGGRRFWLGVAVGGAVVAVALFELATSLTLGRLFNLSLFLGASGIGHDAIWGPAIVLGGIVTLRLPRWGRLPVRLGLALSALLVLFAWPELHGYVGHARNPSADPLDYQRNVAWTLSILWIVVAATCLYRRTVTLRRSRALTLETP